MKDLILGIDTSCYTTSVALTDTGGNIIADARAPLPVKPGALGLRQNEAFFRHIQTLPALTKDLIETYRDRIAAVAASAAPRNLKGSYMPVFTAGLCFAQALSTALNVPLHTFSHQEGHIAAGILGKNVTPNEDFCVFHISGGTFEILIVRIDANGLISRAEIVGGSRDISLGQFIDRTGVALGFDFPAGAAVDAEACNFKERDVRSAAPKLPKIKVNDLYVNLSGIDTAVARHIAEMSSDARDIFAKNTDLQTSSAPGSRKSCRSAARSIPKSETRAICYTVMNSCADCLLALTEGVKLQYNTEKVILAGGVASSTFLNEVLRTAAQFADAGLGSDNAVGISLLGNACLFSA